MEQNLINGSVKSFVCGFVCDGKRKRQTRKRKEEMYVVSSFRWSLMLTKSYGVIEILIFGFKSGIMKTS